MTIFYPVALSLVLRQIQDLMLPTSTMTIDAVHARAHKQCGNCGGSHTLWKCPAYRTTCSKCHKKNHW